MNLVGEKVHHITLGIGIINELDGKYFTVEFSEKTIRFVFPDAFDKFLKAENTEIQKQIEDLLVPTPSPPPPPAPKMKRKIYFAFQNKTFDVELRGGYIWAPIGSPHHWERLKNIRKGDIIIHSCGGYIMALSEAMGSYEQCIQPIEMQSQGLWNKNGRIVECAYAYIKRPIKLSNYKKIIIDLSRGQEYQPFNVNGTGNQGYLFDINQELAKIFIKDSVMNNPYLNNLDYITEILTER